MPSRRVEIDRTELEPKWRLIKYKQMLFGRLFVLTMMVTGGNENVSCRVARGTEIRVRGAWN